MIMGYEEIIEGINTKKKSLEEFYSDLEKLEEEAGRADKFIKPQLFYMLGVDYFLYGEEEKAFEFLYAAFNQIISLIYANLLEDQEGMILTSTLQKIIIEMAKIMQKDNGRPSEVIKMFYAKQSVCPYSCISEVKFRKMVHEFKEVSRVLKDTTSEIFTFLLQTEPQESLNFITHESQASLLVECMKSKDDNKMMMESMRKMKGMNKVLVFLLLYDQEEFEENLEEVRKRIIASQVLKDDHSDSEILLEIFTSCMNTGKHEILKRVASELVGLVGIFSEKDRKGIKALLTDLHECWDECWHVGWSEFVDLEQVVHYWFITSQFKKIIKLGDHVPISTKILFISHSRLGERKNFEPEDSLDKIGASWEVEEEFLKEKVRNHARGKDKETLIKEEVDSVQDPFLKLKILHLLLDLKEFKILSGIVQELGEGKGGLFQHKKVWISFLHLQALGVEVGERLRILNLVDYSRISPSEKEWLYKVLYNNLLEVYQSNNKEKERDEEEEHQSKEKDKGEFYSCVQYSISALLDLSPSSDSFIMALLLNTPLFPLYERFKKSHQDSHGPLVLFYEKFLISDPEKAKEILEGINFKTFEDPLLLYILGIPHGVDTRVVLECFFRKILTQSHFEEILLSLSLKGTIFLFNFLRGLVVINLKDFLSPKSREILKLNLKIVEFVRNSEMILFFENLLSS